MKKDAIRQIVNILAIILALTINGLANLLPLNGRTTGEISDMFQVYFAPAGYVFAIWGVIYLFLVGFAVAQALPGQRENPRLRRVGWLFALSCLANCVWLFAWHYLLFPLTLALMLVLLGLLIAIYLRLGIGKAKVSVAEVWLAQVPFSLYLGWITVATIANVTDLLAYLGWSGWGLRPEIWAVIMLTATAVLASVVSLSRGDVAYMLVIVWAFAGIAIKQAATPAVATAAWAADGLSALMLVVGAFVQRVRGEARN